MNVPQPLSADLAIAGTAVLDQGTVPDALVLVRGGRILFAGPSVHAPTHTAAETVTHPGVVLPGLVDLHCHGGGGVSFPDCERTEDALVAVREHRGHGTTALVASLVTAAPRTLAARVDLLADLVHLEGPFISEARKGAQNPAHITGGDAQLAADLCERSGRTIATMTVAPETSDFEAVVDALAAGGAIPSLGHTDCSSDQMTAGVTASRAALRRHHSRSELPTATHLFNGMRPVHHRDPGPALSALDAASRGEMVVEVIADGVHLDARTVQHVFSIAADEHVVLVTDAMAAAGMPDGAYSLGALDVTVENGVARLTDGGSIAGGTSHLLDVVRFCVQEAGVDLARAVRAASTVPARVLGGQEEFGTLRAGLRADVVLADADLRAQSVLRGGVRV
jgi:N-acetylglucosamine-6-phosphate deacetylase